MKLLRAILIPVLFSAQVPWTSACACGPGVMEGEAAAPSAYDASWAPSQATGKPDTVGYGDIATAWGSFTADDQDEWLQLWYRTPVTASEISIYETFNTGAVNRVTAYRGNQEVELWSGVDPAGTEGERSKVAKIPVNVDFPVQRIKIYVSSKDVLGWNEIDAVGMKDAATGVTHWASRARASSTYAASLNAPVVPYIDPVEERIRALEARILELERRLGITHEE